MEDNKECSLIKDLFPIYIDNLTTNETNEFINNHFSKCNKCLNEYNNVLKKLQDNDYKNQIKKYKMQSKININDLYRNWNFIKCGIYVLLL